MEQIKLFQTEPEPKKKPKKQDRLKILIKELGKELELTKPLTESEKAELAVERGIQICNDFKERGVHPDTILWALGNMMHEELKKLDAQKGNHEDISQRRDE